MKSNMSNPILYIIVPCFNEEEILPLTAKRLNEQLTAEIKKGWISKESRILFVDDGSLDGTWDIIGELHRRDGGVFLGIRLSKNRGHQIALYAGMNIAAAIADAVITIDADLQQDVYAIPKFIEKYKHGFDVVYGVRNNRSSDGILKKVSATIYYKLLRFLGCDLVEQSADYRLMSQRAVQALMQYRENNLFIRGLVPMLGFNTSVVYFDVTERKIGKSKYSLRKMIRLAIDGITSFTIKPLRLFLVFGIIVSVSSVGLMVFNLVTFIQGINISGWTSLSMTTLFLGGVELIGIGVLGEYVGKTYIESKKRPLYFISEAMLDTVEGGTDKG